VLDSLSVDERASTWADLIAGDEAALTIVAENTEGGEMSGFCTLFAPSRDDDAPANVCELAAIYVEPERWRWGIGRALMRAVLDKATGDGFEAVTLWVYGDYAPARRFYESFGFKPDGASRQKPERLDEVRLRLTLA
jgi:GNAT superfamily N-acetyltransferase